ncbi:hypothetical protein [Gemmatimonas sp.]|uniref:hypothetical protein n=1 Tax=Gemmatimonas sp. TaxID=1962908 RepID=UPI0035644DBF
MRLLAKQLKEVADPSIIIPTSRNIAETVDLSAEERDRLVTDAASQPAQILALDLSLRYINDEPDRHRSLAASWSGLRFARQRHNKCANYDTIRTGTCAPIVLARTSTASYSLLCLEETSLAREHFNKLGDAAVELLDCVRTDVESGNLHVAA